MRSILLFFLAVLTISAGDWLPVGIHKRITDEGGRLRFSVIVPEAAADGKEAPVVFVLPNSFGLLDPYPWQPWAERRGCLVVALDDGTPRGPGIVASPYSNVPGVIAHFEATIAAVAKRVNMTPWARVAAIDMEESSVGVAFAKAQGENLGGLLFTRPFPLTVPLDGLPAHLGIFMLLGEHDQGNEREFLWLRSQLRNRGFAVRSGYVLGGKAKDWVPQEGCNTAVDHLLDLALVNHPKWSPIKRQANQEAVITRGQTLSGLDDEPAHEQLGWLLTVPGMEKQKKPIEALANRWVDAGIAIAKAKEATDLVEAHEKLSVVAKRPQAKLADAAHMKSLLAELTRMRKDKAIKTEIVAADSFANTLALIEDDATTAKLKIVLKQLEDLVAKYPATHAGKEAAKLLEKVRMALR